MRANKVVKRLDVTALIMLGTKTAGFDRSWRQYLCCGALA
jgi:hypothetical protein